MVTVKSSLVSYRPVAISSSRTSRYFWVSADNSASASLPAGKAAHLQPNLCNKKRYLSIVRLTSLQKVYIQLTNEIRDTLLCLTLSPSSAMMRGLIWVAIVRAGLVCVYVCEPRQANLCLRAFRHDKFQLRMPSHSEGPGIWLSVWRFLLIHCLYERAAEVLARLRGCAGSPEPSLLA